jgi:hypothetical protein
MNAKLNHIGYLLMFTLITSALNSQTPGQGQNEYPTHENLDTKKSSKIFGTQTISWWDSGNGIIRKVSVDNISQITRYDKQGKYVETLKQKVWNDASALLSTFQQSQYKLQKVTGYWEVSDANKKGYYLELNDNDNRILSVWVDEQGIFSIIPATKQINTANK